VKGDGAGDGGVTSDRGGASDRDGASERILVVAAVVERDGRWLLGLRPRGKRHAEMWEFPGGKVEEDETPTDAIRRELLEEMSLAVTGVGRHRVTIADTDSPFDIAFYDVSTEGEACAIEHASVGWFTAEELSALPLAPADRSFAATLPGP